MGTLELKWGPNGDPKTEKGPHGDQVPQMGTHVGAVARELAGRRRDLMAREERREAQYYYMAHIRGRGGRRRGV